MKGLLLTMFLTYAVTVIQATTTDGDRDHSVDRRASWLDMKRAEDFDPKRASWLDMKRASWLDMKRANENAMKRASWLDMKRGSDFEADKRASWLDMKRASWLDMKRRAEKRASWLDMKRSVGDDVTVEDVTTGDNDQHRREVALLKDELDRLYSRAVEKGTLDNEGLKLLREMLLRKELISPSALRKIQDKLAEIKAYRKQHQQ